MKRFYARATTDGARLLLDGKPAKTRAGNMLEAPTPALAAAIAEEWDKQGERINLAAMPLTKHASTAIDLAERDGARWRGAILVYVVADLLCYRAEAPEALTERQALAWDPILDWARDTIGIGLIATRGVSHVGQPAIAVRAAEAMLECADAHALTGMRTAADATGSAVIALALWKQAFDAERLFAASRVDENFQAERWGVDNEASARADSLRAEFMAASRYLDLLRGL
jgi:chaperone required for assembly of F1-ATPase